LGINELLTEAYYNELISESDGHPYVIKILLGEVAKSQRLVKIQRILAGNDEILDALFERTFVGLSKSAQRIFLTLCNWRSTIPQIALESVLLRDANERMEIGNAIDELERKIGR